MKNIHNTTSAAQTVDQNATSHTASNVNMEICIEINEIKVPISKSTIDACNAHNNHVTADNDWLVLNDPQKLVEKQLHEEIQNQLKIDFHKVVTAQMDTLHDEIMENFYDNQCEHYEIWEDAYEKYKALNAKKKQTTIINFDAFGINVPLSIEMIDAFIAYECYTSAGYDWLERNDPKLHQEQELTNKINDEKFINFKKAVTIHTNYLHDKICRSFSETSPDEYWNDLQEAVNKYNKQ